MDDRAILLMLVSQLKSMSLTQRTIMGLTGDNAFNQGQVNVLDVLDSFVSKAEELMNKEG